jgi:hypothetical protein
MQPHCQRPLQGMRKLENITPPCVVLLSRLYQPVTFFEHHVYCVYLESAGRFVSAQCPVVLDECGELLTLQAEIPVGSVIRVHAIDRFLRTVQVIQRKVINPFATVPITELVG